MKRSWRVLIACSYLRKVGSNDVFSEFVKKQDCRETILAELVSSVYDDNVDIARVCVYMLVGYGRW